MWLYHGAVHPLAERARAHIRRQELLSAGDRVGIAVSGGIDSVALLRLMLELRIEFGIVIIVVHFNHKLRGAESDADEQFVAHLALDHGLEFVCDSDDVAGHAREQGVSLETAARDLRYGFFRYLLREGDVAQERKPESLSTKVAAESRDPSKLSKILTGHTLDDQAETVLMRFVRGAGLRGLGAIHPRIPVEGNDGEICGEILRPLLKIRRQQLERYLRDIGQESREDATNTDESFTRNRVRKLLVPLLEKEFNPAIAEILSELAEIARGEEDYWDNEVAGWMGTGVHWLQPEWAVSKTARLVQIDTNFPASRPKGARAMGHPPGHGTDNDLKSRIDNASWLVMNCSVDRLWFLGEPVAVQRRIVKAVGDEAGIPLEFKHVEQTLRFASEEAKTGKELSLPLGWRLVRHADELLFVTPDLRKDMPLQDYEYSLPIPGRVDVHESAFTIEARRISADEAAEYNPDQLLNADSVTGPLVVRNWRAGDRYWPAHTKSPKKIKELLQERHVPQPERGRWPVVVKGEEIIWMRGFPVPAKDKAEAGRSAIIIVDSFMTPSFST